YTSIIKARFAGRLQIDFKKPEKLSNIYIPASTIQSLVENCIQDGLRDKSTVGKVESIMELNEEDAWVAVRDTGKDYTTERLQDVENGGIGIYNVNKRLIRLLGKGSGLTIRNLPGGGSEVFFYIPRKNHLERQAITG